MQGSHDRHNDVASWNYSQLPAAFGCTDWLSARVTTNGELNATMADLLVADLKRCLAYFAKNPVTHSLSQQEAGGFNHS